MSRRQTKFNKEPRDNTDVVPMVVTTSNGRPSLTPQQSTSSALVQSSAGTNRRQPPSEIVAMKDATDDEEEQRPVQYQTPNHNQRHPRQLSLSLQPSGEIEPDVIMSTRSKYRDERIESPRNQMPEPKKSSSRESPLLFDDESPRNKRVHSRRQAYEVKSIDVEPISPSSAGSISSATRKAPKSRSAVNTPRDMSTPVRNGDRLNEEFAELARLDEQINLRRVTQSEPKKVTSVSRTQPKAVIPTTPGAIVVPNVAISQEVKDGLDLAISLRINDITAKQVEQSLVYQKNHVQSFITSLEGDQQLLQSTSTGPLYVEDASDYKFSNSVARTVRTWQVSAARSKTVLLFMLQYGIPLYTYIVEKRNREARLFYMTYLQKFEGIWHGKLPKTLSLNAAIHIYSALLGDTHRMVSVLKTMSISYVLYEPAV